jgi:hypothetical protein
VPLELKQGPSDGYRIGIVSVAENIVQGESVMRYRSDGRNVNRGRKDKINLKFSEMITVCAVLCGY